MVGIPYMAKFLDLMQGSYRIMAIVAQYSISGEPQQNRVAERRNRTMNGYSGQYDKLLHLTVEPVDGGVKNRHSYSQKSTK